MRLVSDQERHAAINAPKHEEIARQRDHRRRTRPGLRLAVVRLHNQDVVTRSVDGGRRIETEPRKRASMLAEVVTVQPDIGNRPDAVKLEKVTANLPGRGREPQPIPPDPLHAVRQRRPLDPRVTDPVPGVRHIDRLPRRVVKTAILSARDRARLLESPAVVETDRNTRLAGKNRQHGHTRHSQQHRPAPRPRQSSPHDHPIPLMACPIGPLTVTPGPPAPRSYQFAIVPSSSRFTGRYALWYG